LKIAMLKKRLDRNKQTNYATEKLIAIESNKAENISNKMTQL